MKKINNLKDLQANRNFSINFNVIITYMGVYLAFDRLAERINSANSGEICCKVSTEI